MLKKWYLDFNFIATIVLLICFGLVMLYSTSYYSAELKFGDDMYYLVRQALYSLGALVGMILVSRIPYQAYGKLSVAILIVSWGLMILVQTPFGVEVNGARRWLKFPGLPQFQPSEIAKIAIVLFIPYLIYRRVREGRFKTFKDTLGIWIWTLITCLIVYLGTDHLSTAIVIFGMVFVMVFVAHEKTVPFILAALGGITAAVGGAFLLASRLDSSGSFRLRRLLAWVDPEKYADSGGYQIMQGLYAIGSGKFFGKGLGNSAQKLGFIPESQNDMIISIIAEEFGVFGVLFLLIMFGLLLYRLLYIANHAPDLYGSLITFGIFSHIAIQVILNICVVLNLIPTTGITLPFVSYGGTAIIFLLLEMGVALGISSQIKRKQEEEEDEKMVLEN